MRRADRDPINPSGFKRNQGERMPFVGPIFEFCFGGAERDRTADLLVANSENDLRRRDTRGCGVSLAPRIFNEIDRSEYSCVCLSDTLEYRHGWSGYDTRYDTSRCRPELEKSPPNR
jgi:hypothetical protein